LQAKFASTSVGSYIGTVAADLKFQLWGEDASQAYNSGRRFRLVASIPSTPRVPFASLDFKTVEHVYTYLALIDRHGLLSVYEPTSPDDLREWTLLDQKHVCTPVPSRGDETSFKVRWDQNETPLPYMNSLSDDDKQMGLIVSSLNEVKIYHSKLESDETVSETNRNGASQRLTFHEVFKLPTHPALVRDVSWCPYNIRGTERIATACKDGSVSVFELLVVAAQGYDHKDDTSAKSQQGGARAIKNRLPAQSSLTSAITGRTSSQPSSQSMSLRPASFPFAYKVQHVSTLPAHGDAWTVGWDGQGQILMSGGSDGVTKLWRKSVQSGSWMLFADQAVDFGTPDEQ
jgi:WD40 repeat protein